MAMLNEIKHQFMAYRNGIVADTLRKAGMPYTIIFGLQLPQLSEIARGVGKSLSLANELWADKGVRESRLLACRIYPVEEIDVEKGIKLASEVQTREEADILAFSLLRRHPGAAEIARCLESSTEALPRYAAEAIKRNLEQQ